MPELPEVETVRADLARSLFGRTVLRASFHHPRTVRRQTSTSLIEALAGRRLVEFDRIGKFLLLGLDDETWIVVHLRMSGALSLVASGAPRELHTHAVLELDDDTELRFVDPRTFGEWFATRLGPSGRPVELAQLGPDPIRDGLSKVELAGIVKNRRAAVKAVLLNQHLIAGIGNIYGDEICHRAAVLPTRAAGELSDREVSVLARSIETVLREAVDCRGSTLGDARYTDLSGQPGRFQERHAVYGRGGEPCARCGTEIARAVIGGRSAHYCPSCQV